MTAPRTTEETEQPRIAAVRLRFFAAAAEASGLDELVVAVKPGESITGALLHVPSAPGHELGPVLARCSFLHNAVATTDRATTLADGDIVDVLPPFAGG